MLEDGKIVELFLMRAEEAIGELSAKYGKNCTGIAKNILKNDLDAEECVNDTLLAAWNTIPPQKPEPLRAYIFRIARNIAIARYHSNTSQKRNSHYDIALDELADCIPTLNTVEDEISARELSRQIDLFLASLSEENRVMFVRRYWYSDSISDIAERFKISEGNASVRLSRIRGKLKRHLEREGVRL